MSFITEYNWGSSNQNYEDLDALVQQNRKTHLTTEITSNSDFSYPDPYIDELSFESVFTEDASCFHSQEKPVSRQVLQEIIEMELVLKGYITFRELICYPVRHNY